MLSTTFCNTPDSRRFLCPVTRKTLAWAPATCSIAAG